MCTESMVDVQGGGIFDLALIASSCCLVILVTAPVACMTNSTGGSGMAAMVAAVACMAAIADVLALSAA